MCWEYQLPAWLARLAGMLLSKARQVPLCLGFPAFARILFCVFFIRVPQVKGKLVTACRVSYRGKA